MSEYARPLVSVVTPVHNGEDFLAECIRSVRNQTYGQFEYLIVNNGSSDRSLEIARAHAAEDPRIRVHDNERFLGALQNFNHALRQISPESRYCKVVHADDWLYPECLEKMVDLAEARPGVGIVGSYRLVGNGVESDGLPYDRSVFSGRETGRMNLLCGPYTFGSPSALLIRSDLIRTRDPFYNEAHSGADTEACLDLLRECDFGFVHQVLSYCRKHEGAITGRQSSLGTGYPNFLYVFKKYGPFYLSESEYQEGLQRQMKGYYRFLGSRIHRFLDRRFRDFHRQGLRNVGASLQWRRVVAGTVREIAGRAVDSPRLLKHLAGQGRRGRRQQGKIGGNA